MKLQFDKRAKEPFYNCLTKVAALENLDVFCLNRSEKIYFHEPSKFKVKELYESHKHCFSAYSEQFILYYLFKRNQIRSSFSMRDLVEIVSPQVGELIRAQNKLNSSGYSENKIVSPNS